jgi:hypothetical protein
MAEHGTQAQDVAQLLRFNQAPQPEMISRRPERRLEEIEILRLRSAEYGDAK